MFTHFRVHLNQGYNTKGYTDVRASNYEQRNSWVDFFDKDGSKIDSFAAYSVVRIQQIKRVTTSITEYN